MLITLNKLKNNLHGVINLAATKYVMFPKGQN